MEERRKKDTKDEEANYEKLIFESDEGTEEFYVLEQTRLAGINYIAVTDNLDERDGTFLIMKECADEDEEYTSYEIVDDEETLKAVIPVFDELLEDYDLEV